MHLWDSHIFISNLFGMNAYENIFLLPKFPFYNKFVILVYERVLTIVDFVIRIRKKWFYCFRSTEQPTCQPQTSFFVNRLAKNKNKLGFSKPKLILGQLNIQFNVEFV